MIRYTTNGGTNWVNQTSPNSSWLYSVQFINSTTGYAAGTTGTILRTTNSGLNWLQQVTGIGDNMYGLHFPSQLTGYSVGTTGRIIKTTNGGLTIIEPIGNEVPADFSLKQNYPNPFNPTTNIEFQIADFSYVNLIVYDAIGRVVETLVNGELKPGIYKADWNATDFPGGVYFYKLSAAEFTQTKKMILIK